MRSQLASAVVLGLLIAGCGGDGENFVGGGFNGGGGGDAPVKPSISLGSTTLFRPTRQLFPNLGVTGPLLGDSVVTIVLTGDGTLKKPLDGPKNTSTLSADGKTLTVNFTNATAEEITSYLKANLTPDTITGPRKEAKVKVTLANAGASAEGSADLLTANKGALVLKVEPGAAGVVTNVDTGADTTKRGLQQALDLVAAVSSGSEGAGSVIGLATGEFPIADSAFSTGLGIRVHPDADLAFLTIAGPNVGNPGDPNVPTGSSARVAGAVLRGATGNGGGFSQAMLSVQASDVLLRGLDLVVPGSNSLRAGVVAPAGSGARLTVANSLFTTDSADGSVGCDFEESGADFVRNRVQGLSFGVLFTSTAGPNKARLNAFVDPKFTGVYLLGSNTRATLDSNVYRLADASTMNSIAFVSTLASNAVTVTNSDFYPRAVFNTLVTQTDGGVVVQSGNFSADANKNPVLNGTFSANFFSPTSLFDKATANFPGFTP